jgi:hypothetical protein
MKATAGVGRISEPTQFGRFAPVFDSDLGLTLNLGAP